MRIIPRAEWNARAPKNRSTTSPGNRVYYIVHHSGGPVTQTVRAIQDWCMDGRGFSDIDYNFLVRGSTGEIYEGRGWDVIGAHTANYNTNGAGVCIIGTDTASDAAKASVRWLYEQYNKRCGKTLKIRGHRDLATTGTDCPGDRVYAWVHAGMPAPTAPEDDDVKFTDLAWDPKDPPAWADPYVELMTTPDGVVAQPTFLNLLLHGMRHSAEAVTLNDKLGSTGPTVGVSLQSGYGNTVATVAQLTNLKDQVTALSTAVGAIDEVDSAELQGKLDALEQDLQTTLQEIKDQLDPVEPPPAP